jgi:hypothetical protein
MSDYEVTLVNDNSKITRSSNCRRGAFLALSLTVA